MKNITTKVDPTILDLAPSSDFRTELYDRMMALYKVSAQYAPDGDMPNVCEWDRVMDKASVCDQTLKMCARGATYRDLIQRLDRLEGNPLFPGSTEGVLLVLDLITRHTFDAVFPA